MPGHGEQVSLDRLRQLLDQGEGDDLDFKVDCNLDERHDVVAIAKDVGAFSAAGGHLIIGVEESGRPAGRLTPSAAALFDAATLRAKLAPRYLPETISITTAVHEIDGAPVVIVYIAAHPDGFVVMQRDGDYAAPDGRQRQEFRAGEVYIRRGSASRVWNHDEARAALERAMASRRERWRAELREDLAGLGVAEQAQRIARGPAAAFTWQLDNDAFVATLVELLRAEDDIPISLGFEAMLSDAVAAHTGGRADQLTTILDRLISAAAVAVSVQRPALLQTAIDGLLHIYNLGFDAAGWPRSVPNTLRPEQLWRDIITRVYALGGLAVRKQDWPSVRLLTLQRGAGRDFERYSNWLRHALTRAANADLLQARVDDRRVELSLLTLAAEHVDRLVPLRPDLPSGEDAIVNSLAQFDLLSILVTIDAANSTSPVNWYTNFARFGWSRSEPALVAVITGGPAREVVFARSDQDLADAIRAIGQAASSEGFRWATWTGWESPVVSGFLDAHPPRE